MSTRDYPSGATRLTLPRPAPADEQDEGDTTDVGTVVSGVRDSMDSETADAALTDYLKTSRRIYERIERAMRFVRAQPKARDDWQARTLERLLQLQVAGSKSSSHE